MSRHITTAVRRALRGAGQLERVRDLIEVHAADWPGCQQLRLPASVARNLKLPCAIAVVAMAKDVIATLLLTSLEGGIRVQGMDAIVLDGRHYTVLGASPSVLALSASQGVPPPPPEPEPKPRVFTRTKARAHAKAVCTPRTGNVEEDLKQGRVVGRDTLTEELYEYWVALADAAAIANLGPENASLHVAAHERWRRFALTKSVATRHRCMAFYALAAVATQSRAGRQAWYRAERTLVRVLMSHDDDEEGGEGTVAVPLLDWLGCGGKEGIDADAVPVALKRELVDPYVHGRELELWMERRHAIAAVHKHAIMADQELEDLFKDMPMPNAEATSEELVADSLSRATLDAAADAAWTRALTYALKEKKKRRRRSSSEGGTAIATEPTVIHDIEDLLQHAPPCMAAVLAHGRRTGHLKHTDRMNLTTWFFRLGITDAETIVSYAQDQPVGHAQAQELVIQVAKEQKRWATSAPKKPACLGCAGLRKVTVANKVAEGNAVRCPFDSADACLRVAGMPPNTRLYSPPDYVKAHAYFATVPTALDS